MDTPIIRKKIVSVKKEHPLVAFVKTILPAW